MSDSPLRIGLLGAARVAVDAVLAPARELASVEVAGVAARDRKRAEAFASEHGVARVYADYDALLADAEIDVVYVPLPTSLHLEWALAAVEAGKHVLCEKPLTANADEAERLVAAADAAGRTVVEAYHWRYHPLAARLLELLGSGRISDVVSVEGVFTVPKPDGVGMQHDLALGGGAMLNLGCYAVHWARTVVGAEPRVAAASAEVGRPGIDVAMTAELAFPGGIVGRVQTSMAPDAAFGALLVVEGTGGRIRVDNPLVPHLGHALTVWDEAGEVRETVEGRSTYWHQLATVAEGLRSGAPMPTGGADSVATMRVLDDIYRAAGLDARGG
ncbi:MAG TPA: Gfo/Idh/MocA family oxidoreductase [Acidimicrobiales bacterium]|nr:Gfo/Idh/MocA family oxidoreductase [Acidimicrobiales bacterium]